MPSQLLEQLLAELSTLASVYHKPPEAFLGQGRFGAEAMQRAAIEYVFYKLQRSFILTCAHQGTTRECTGKSNCCRCRRSSGFWGPGPAAIKHRESTRYRFRWLRACLVTEAAGLGRIGAGGTGRHTTTRGLARNGRWCTCIHNGRSAWAFWGRWGRWGRCGCQQRHDERVCGYGFVGEQPAAAATAATGWTGCGEEQPGAVGSVLDVLRWGGLTA